MTRSIPDPIPISGIDQIDLDSHAVIEASAGTGKTYTIENLVVSLLKSGRVMNLEEILVVTFTEKAAGELRDRIRENIKKELCNDTSRVLQTCLDNFDSASIFTIHGFCNTILQEYAFENGEQFQNELADDRNIYQQALYRIMRDEWPSRYGKELPNILRISRYPGTIVNGTSTWENRVLDLAIRYQPLGNDRILPGTGPDLPALIQETEKECRSYLDDLERVIGLIDRQDVTKSDFPSRYATLNIHKNSMGKRLRIINCIVKLLADCSTGNVGLNEIDDLFSNLDLNENGFDELNSRWRKDGPDYQEKLPHLPAIITLLEKLRALDINTTRSLLMAATVHELKTHASQYKQARGLISYDDMIIRVYHSLADKSSLLTKVLQKKYTYALVDEFQDTDMIQWKIFSAIFLNSKKSRLFIIGDPKQSIYGFRGADVHAYYLARDEMIHTHAARYYCLNENWRSSPDLISSFNVLFAGKQWFSDPNIQYLPSHYPVNQDPGKHPDTASLVIMDCGTCSGTEAKYMSAHFIVRELQRIIAENRSLPLNKIAILVTKWKEAEIIEKYLKNYRISYSFYKKEGLFQSIEAFELSLLLTAIAHPSDSTVRKKALITRFFSVPVRELYRYTAINHAHPADALYNKWIAMSDQKQWPLLFQSIMEDTGILFRDMDEHDRAIINYRTILQNLEIEAYHQNLSIRELVDHLNGLMQKTSNSHDTYNIEAIDLDKPGVQILTIHASKGLEFNTVFVAGGYTKRARSEFWTYHENGCRVFDLVRNSDNKTHYDLEMASEDERLFYVAFTRARDRLYIPVYEPGSRSRNTAGILGDKMFSILPLLRKEQHIQWPDIKSEPDTDNAASQHSADPVEPRLLPNPLFPDISANFLDRRIIIDSFSALKTRLYDSGHDALNDYRGDISEIRFSEDDEPFVYVIPPLSGSGTPQELPHSKETGIMLHEILEHIDFQKAGHAQSASDLIVDGIESSSLIEQAIRRHLNPVDGPELEALKALTAGIVWNTLNAPLGDSQFCLKQVTDKIHEVEFYYPCPQAQEITVPETSYHDGFMHGFIDMIFLYNKKYYIIDWKSNYIEAGYTRDLIENNIRDMHYDLQITIYNSALLRWLQHHIPNYHYETHFGGIFYLYLRGMNSSNPRSGVYFHRPLDETFKKS